MVFFSDPKAIKQIFTADPDQFRAGGAMKIFEPLFRRNSVLVLDGTRHRRERRLLMPPFHGEHMRLYGEMMSEIADQSINAWPVGVSFPIRPHLQAITLNIILRVVFGMEDESRLSRLRNVIVEALGLVDFGNPFRPIVAWWRFGRVRREIDVYLHEEIRRRRQALVEGRTDIMSMLLAVRDEDGVPMSDEEVRDEMFTMLAAGHATTTTLLAWVIRRLLEHPDALATASAEMASVVGTGNNLPPPSAEQVGQLVCLDAAIKESARLNPVIPIVAQQVQREATIGNTTLPVGCVVTPPQ